ncbi:MAG TPA: hypothetical protein VG938_16300 [Verrucomicrobiae bacterium]|jgi:hypothetical protein|nr:hypothetical protein [Verrucomicrobiae bacterium]
MEVGLNTSRVPGAEPSQPATRQDTTAAATDEASFEVTAALQDKLKNLPTLRPDKVEQAKMLISDSKYPPDDVLDRIAVLIAAKVKS